MGGFADEASDVRELLDGRFDDLESGAVELVDGEEAFRRLKEKAAQGMRIADD